MKKNVFKTVRCNIGNGFNPATPERFAETIPAVEYDPKPPSMPEAWYKELMAAIYRIGPLRKPSLLMNDETTR